MAGRVALFLASFLVICGATVLFPQVDLASSAAFYVPGRGFPLGEAPLLRAIHEGMPVLVAAIIVAGAGLIALRRWRAGLFLLLALAVGPGLIVNVVFKDHWGRARPAQIAAFGGTERFSPPFVPSDQCDRNCSFPAGDPANGFVLCAAGFLATTRRRRTALLVGSVGAGLFLGFMRMAQGGHFLSDVLASGFLVFASTWLLYRWIIARDGLRALAVALRQPPRGLRQFYALLVASAAGAFGAILWLDRPIARHFAGTDGITASFFRFVTEFGVSTPYLVVAATLAAFFGVAARNSGDPVRQRAYALRAWRSVFVFAAVGGTGLAGDIMKPLFGRARPRLYLSDGVFGFTWHGAHAAYWSFPSGHAITIVALATSLAMIDRRWLPAGVLVALLVIVSRIVLVEHYVSDVIAGALLAWTGCQIARALFRRAGGALALSSP